MKAKVYRLNSGVSRLFLFALIAVMPGLVQAQSATDGQAVKALTTDASGALLVLRNSGLLAVEGQSTTEIPLPPSDSGAPPRSMAKGADERLYLAGPGLGIWRYEYASERWHSLNDTLPDLGITAIAAHATQPETLYAYLGDGGMFRSRDDGAEWVKVDNGPREPVQAFLQHIAPLALAQPYGHLLAVFQNIFGQRLNLFGIQRLGALRRNIDLAYRESQDRGHGGVQFRMIPKEG